LITAIDTAECHRKVPFIREGIRNYSYGSRKQHNPLLMADIELENVKDCPDLSRCPQTKTDGVAQTDDGLDDGYLSGGRLVLNLLAIALATVLVGYVSLS
jgi:hypothetical protein